MYLFLPYFSENNHIHTQAEFQAEQKGYNTVRTKEFKKTKYFYVFLKTWWKNIK